jgi:hypothetical protein
MKLELVELASKQDGQTSQQCKFKESMKLELVELASKQDGQTSQQCEFKHNGSKDRHSPYASKANESGSKHEIGTC